MSTVSEIQQLDFISKNRLLLVSTGARPELPEQTGHARDFLYSMTPGGRVEIAWAGEWRAMAVNPIIPKIERSASQLNQFLGPSWTHDQFVQAVEEHLEKLPCGVWTDVVGAHFGNFMTGPR